MCLFPRQVKVKKDGLTSLVIPAPCGRCPECLSKQRREWYVRNRIEADNAENCFFITLTYNEQHLPISDCNGFPCFSVRDIQLFFKRLRKRLVSSSLKYFLASEYGGQFGRPHYHALIYNVPNEKVSLFPSLLAESWGNGFTSVSPVTNRRINYVCKYMLQKVQRKKDYSDPAQAPFYLSSRRPAIGSSYLSESNICFHLGNKTTKFNYAGVNYTLPQYFKRKIFEPYPEIQKEIRDEYLQKMYEELVPILQDSDTYNDFVNKTRRETVIKLGNFIKLCKKNNTLYSSASVDIPYLLKLYNKLISSI